MYTNNKENIHRVRFTLGPAFNAIDSFDVVFPQGVVDVVGIKLVPFNPDFNHPEVMLSLEQNGQPVWHKVDWRNLIPLKDERFIKEDVGLPQVAVKKEFKLVVTVDTSLPAFAEDNDFALEFLVKYDKPIIG